MRNQDHYKGYTEEQFAADEFFQKWVLMPDDENEKFWWDFIEKTPSRKIAIENARKLVEHLTENGFHIPFLSAVEKQELKSSIFGVIGQSVGVTLTDKPAFSGRSAKGIWWSLVAGVLAIVTGFVFFKNGKKEEGVPGRLVKTNTVSRQVKEILLPDNSIVILNGNSSVSYPEQFNTALGRDVFLEGNAYFKIKNYQGKPFVVHTKQMEITVTGTEFNVNSRLTTTNVVLTQGSIRVSLPGEDHFQKAYMLQPGETLQYNSDNGELVTGTTRTELYTNAWGDNEWHFDNTSLATVSGLIDQFYGTEVVFGNEQLKTLTISAVVSVKDFSTLIRVIEKTLNIAITEEPGKIFIN
ncbi:MAG: FecR domain-containing protein [Chitinophagaceae bacterium]|nr:FecR domain-containing protein [Chitinophagaceae bacterium]MCW5926285.1 FecR domain-containing protein [Chitinophagaceae bacterium]